MTIYTYIHTYINHKKITLSESKIGKINVKKKSLINVWIHIKYTYTYTYNPLNKIKGYSHENYIEIFIFSS